MTNIEPEKASKLMKAGFNGRLEIRPAVVVRHQLVLGVPLIPEKVTGKERKKLFQKFSKHKDTEDLFHDENKMKEFMR